MLIIKEWRCMSARFPRVLLAHPQWLFLKALITKLDLQKNIERRSLFKRVAAACINVIIRKIHLFQLFKLGYNLQ